MLSLRPWPTALYRRAAQAVRRGHGVFQPDSAVKEAARDNMNREILAAGLSLVGWRNVPID
jgi:glutamate synthase domain-containing protein 1